jgi:hypothetical protein
MVLQGNRSALPHVLRSCSGRGGLVPPHRLLLAGEHEASGLGAIGAAASVRVWGGWDRG